MKYAKDAYDLMKTMRIKKIINLWLTAPKGAKPVN